MAWSESRQPPAVASRTYPPFEKNEADTEGSFYCSKCRRNFRTADPAVGMAQFKQHNCETVRKQNSGMDNFDKYDEIDYSGKSDPDIWETHLEFFFSRQTALRRYAEIKRLHPEAAKKTAVRPFFRPTGEIEIHPDMIKDFTSENLKRRKVFGSSNTGCPRPKSRRRNMRTGCQRRTRKVGQNIASGRSDRRLSPQQSRKFQRNSIHLHYSAKGPQPVSGQTVSALVLPRSGLSAYHAGPSL